MVDQILARATQLSDEELFALTQALNAENSKRENMRQIKDWQRVVDAINNYTSRWGAIAIRACSDGSERWIGESFTYATSFPGEIEIED